MGNFNKNNRGQLKRFGVIALIFAIVALFYYAIFHDSSDSSRHKMKEVHHFLSWDNHVQGIFYRVIAAQDYKHTILFLHGQAFTSEIWHKIGTLDTLSKQGYRVIAVDLPGHGKSNRIRKPDSMEERGKFLERLLNRLHAAPVVLVVPSMSGSFALPYMMKHVATLQSRLSGFVPVAPVATDQYSVKSFGDLNVRTLITYGELDTKLGHVSLERLKHIPGSVMNMIKDAPHACYVKKPEVFHKTLQRFLKRTLEA